MTSKNNPRELFKKIVDENPEHIGDLDKLIDLFVVEMLREEHLDELKEVLRRWGTKIFKSNYT